MTIEKYNERQEHLHPDDPFARNPHWRTGQGERAEVHFIAKCFCEYGHQPCIPVGTDDFDMVVVANKRPLRVQIKSTNNKQATITKASNKGNQIKYCYPEDTIDWFALHHIPTDDWYVIPRHLTGDKMSVSFKSLDNKWKNNFDFIDYTEDSGDLEEFFG